MNITQDQFYKPVIIKPRHQVDYNSWPLDWLLNYIEKLQRKTLTAKAKAILQQLCTVKSCCVNRNNYCLPSEKLFTELVMRLSAHMNKEEQHLFPFIREMMQAVELGHCINRAGLDKMERLVNLLNDEHATAAKWLKSGAELRENWKATGNPGKAVNTLLAALAEFDQACQLHIDLQNKFLFPKIIAVKYAVA